MAANKIIRFGPIALTNTLTTNILNPAITSLAGVIGFTMTQPYLIIRNIRIINKTSGAVSCSFWLGATGANAPGTEVIGIGLSVSANSYIPWSGLLRLDAADFLVGGASANTSLTLEGEGEIGVS